jgi:septal ring factor EnvC (AmiA/AmiB activator)
MKYKIFVKFFFKACTISFPLFLMSGCGPIKPAFYESGTSLKTFAYIPKPPELRIKDLQGSAANSLGQKSEEVNRNKNKDTQESCLTQNKELQSQESKDLLPWPVKGKIAITFAEQEEQKKHLPGAVPGIHILSYKNSPVKAALPGIVSYSGTYVGAMKVVIVKSYPDVNIAYGYLGGEIPKKGDRVSAGQIIGHVEGKHNRPVLYFAVKKGNIIVDPLKLLKPDQ